MKVTMTNLHSTTELTEFVPLSPEAKQSGVASVFSKLFRFSRDNSGENELRGTSISNPGSAGPSPSKEEMTVDSNWTIINSDDQDDLSLRSVVSDYRYSYPHRMEARNLPNVLRRVSNLLASKNKQQSLVYNDTNLKQYWMPDSVSKECYDCGKKFTYYRRRHHCRICGQIFCAHCCNQEVPGKIIGCCGNLRVCTYCCKVVLSYLQDNELSMDLKALQEDLLSKFGDSNEDVSSDVSSSSRSRTPTELGRRKISVVYQEEKFATGWTETTVNPEREKSRNSEPASLYSLLQEMINGENALSVHNQIIDGVRYESCFAGSQLIDWLIANRKTQSRTHSLAIGQVLLDAYYIESLTSNSVDFIDGIVFYKFTEMAFKSNEIDSSPAREIVSRSLVERNTTTSQSGFRLDLNIHKNTAHISRHPQKSTNNKDKKKITTQLTESSDEVIETFVREYRKLDRLSPTPWNHVEVESLHSENNELSVYNSLSDTFNQHLGNAVDQLLAFENISLSWAQIIIPLAEAALQEIKLDYSKTDVIHIGHFIQVKKLPGGERKDSFMVRGIVCSKDVAHREMCTRLVNPRILLLQGAIVYQRVEGRLLSLEPVMMQEQEYLRNTVARIVSLQPDLVLVHRNVSRIAQESLNSYGITLVLNVKMSVMERIARCTNADILTSVDAHVGTTRLGSCRSFYTKKFTLKDGATKTLMFFEGCAFPQLGCTILLRGASEAELKKLKKVANAVAFMKYNAKLEKSFLLDEFAEPPTVPVFTFIGDTTSPKRNALPIVAQIAAKQAVPSCAKESKRGACESARKDVSRIDDKRVSTKSVVQVDDDPLHLAASRPDDESHSSDAAPEELSFAEVPIKRNEFKAALRDTVLSFSPFIQFNLPYLETESGLSCKLRKYFPSDIYYSSPSSAKELTRLSSSDNSASLKPVNVLSVQMKPVHPFVVTKLKDNVNSADVQSLLALYRACGGRLEPSIVATLPLKNSTAAAGADTKLPDVNVFDPRNHQRLSVLFCSFSSISNNSPEFCVSPSIVNMDFYGCNDIPLGNFLERYCFRRSYICPSTTCDTPMIDHERRFVHETGCIQVSLHDIESLPDNDNLPILFWSSCTVCRLSTPVVAMSNDAWNMSFAKYLELRFHAGKYGCRADSAKNCHHSLHQDFIQYFYRSNIVASFKYTDIVLWEISLPPSILEIQPIPIQVSLFLDELKKWAVTGHEIFSNILEKLCSYDTESTATIQGLKKHLSKQKAILKQKTDDIQVILTSSEMNDVSNTDIIQKNRFKLEDSLVSMKKTVAKALFDWKAVLTKLDANKREDRQKSKSHSSDVCDNSQKVSAGSVTEDNCFVSDENLSSLDSRDDSSVDISMTAGDKNDVFDGGSDISAQEFADSGVSQFNCSSSSNETVNSVALSSTSDKNTVKAFLSQLLPNTFQNTGYSLSNPINADEHYVLDFTLTIPLVVYESEPSSIIACALSSNQYLHLLEECVARVAANAESTPKIASTKKESLDIVSISSNVELPQISDNDDLSKVEGAEESKAKGAKSTDAYHFEVSFSDSSTNFTVKVYFAQEFKEIRELVFPAGEEIYIRSLSRCVRWAAHGGKSGSSFCKTKDDRFILKEMSNIELQLFRLNGLSYFNFVRKCHTSQQPTLLVKIVGVYRVKYRNTSSNQTFHSNLLVMENLFYMRDVIRKFDLKGSVRNRLVNTKSDHAGELVLLDENLINMTCDCPLYIYPHSKIVLMKAINNDVTFLASQYIMDYSLLVGLDESCQELVVGIIDYIRTFTWDKKIEKIVKSIGSQRLPTIVSPEEYKSRFIAAMHKYFLAVPDQWQGFGKGIDSQTRF